MSAMIKICLGISAILILFTYILNKKSYDFEKLSQYECGIEPFDEHIIDKSNETREKFYLKFYIIGIIFLIFDLESILLYPIVLSPSLPFIFSKDVGLDYINTMSSSLYNSSISNINYTGYIIFIIFMVMLIIGLIYEYNKKILN